MIAGTPTAGSHITDRQRHLLLAASVMTSLLVAMGGIVCATESAAGCPDWPGCYGRLVPPPQVNAVIEYTHRLIAALTSPLIVAAALLSWRNTRSLRWVTRPLLASLVFVAAVAIFGALTVLVGLPRGLAALDLASALTALALVLTATTVAFVRDGNPRLPDRLSVRSPLARLSLAALIAVFAVHVSGILVAGNGSLTRCLGWPTWRVLPADLAVWAQVARLALAAGAALLIIAVVLAVRRSATGSRLRGAATVLAAVFLLQMVLSIALPALGTSAYLLIAYVAAATLVWVFLVVVTVLACAPDAAVA